MVKKNNTRPPFKNLWSVGDEVTLGDGAPRMLVVDFGEPGDVVVAWRDEVGQVRECSINKLLLSEW